MKIKNCNAIVTGGASGLGGATVSEIIKKGGKVTIFDVQEDKCKAKSDELGKNCSYQIVDVTSETSIELGIKRALENFGEITLVVNCAGLGIAKKVLGYDEIHSTSLFNKVIQINLIGTFNIIRSAANKMQNNLIDSDGCKGVIINTASIAAYDGQVGQAAYSASKAGIVGFTLPIAREFAKIGIRVCTIAPGLFETPMLNGLPDEAKKSLINSTLFPHRLGKPAEFANLVNSIYENNMLNGETIRLDGSIRLKPR